MTTATLEYIDLKKIKPDPANPRKTFGEAEHEALVASVKQHGIQTPLRLRRNGDDGYIITAGERRFRAAKAAKLTQVPAIIADDTGSSVEALVENLVREDLNPIEEGDAYRALSESGKTIAEISKLVSRPETRVDARIHLAGMPAPARDALIDGRAGIGELAAFAELAAQLPQFAEALAWACDLSNGWSRLSNPWTAYFDLDRLDPSKETGNCPDCDGAGEVEDLDTEMWDSCATCEGTGSVTSDRADAPVMPQFFAWPIGGYGSVPQLDMMVSQLTPEAQERVNAATAKAQELYDAKKAKDKYGYFQKVPHPTFDSDLVDVARAAGVLQAIGHGEVIVDPAWVSEYLPDVWDRQVEEYLNPRKQASSSSNGTSSMSDEERDKRAVERDDAKKARAKARTFNADLGVQIQQSIGEVEVTTDAMKLIVSTILDATKTRDYRGLQGRGHALFQRFTGVVPLPTNKAGDVKAPRSTTDRAEFVTAAYQRAEKELKQAKTPEQALGVLVRFLAHGLADLKGLPNADLNEMLPYHAAGWRKFVAGKLPAAFRRRIPAENGIKGRSYAWTE